MPPVTLAYALKEKNRQIKHCRQLQEKITEYNSRVVGADRPFEVEAVFAELEAGLMRLVEIKSVIHHANEPIAGKIFEMAELRGLLQFLQRLDTKKGKQVAGYQGEIVEYEVDIDAKQKSEIRERLEKRLDALQDEVDLFNAKTTVDLPMAE